MGGPFEVEMADGWLSEPPFTVVTAYIDMGDGANSAGWECERHTARNRYPVASRATSY